MTITAAPRATIAWCCLLLLPLASCEYCRVQRGVVCSGHELGPGEIDPCLAAAVVVVAGGAWAVAQVAKGVGEALEREEQKGAPGVAWDSPEGIALRSGREPER